MMDGTPKTLLGIPLVEDPTIVVPGIKVLRMERSIPFEIKVVDGKPVMKFPDGWGLSPWGFAPPDDREGWTLD